MTENVKEDVVDTVLVDVRGPTERLSDAVAVAVSVLLCICCVSDHVLDSVRVMLRVMVADAAMAVSDTD